MPSIAHGSWFRSLAPAVSALEKPDSSITLRHQQMPRLVGFLLWTVIQVQVRSGFHKWSWLVIPPETGVFRP